MRAQSDTTSNVNLGYKTVSNLDSYCTQQYLREIENPRIRKQGQRHGIESMENEITMRVKDIIKMIIMIALQIKVPKRGCHEYLS